VSTPRSQSEAERAGLIQALLARQNADGGWPYAKGVSWTEPTVLAALALLAGGHQDSADRGICWLETVGRADGGWAPQPAVAESTWVTSLVTLLPPERLGEARHGRGLQWLIHLTGRESTSLEHLRMRMKGVEPQPEWSNHGWPWFPGAAAWVGPTSMAILALRKQMERKPSAQVEARIGQGRRFLLSRTCQGGGWNHGSQRALGQDGLPYPEMTGLALAALAGCDAPEIAPSLVLAEKLLRSERSADAQTCLRLGLLAHGRPIPSPLPSSLPCRTVRDMALRILVEEAAQGRNWL
jgi:hypothetical protein